MKKKHEIFKFLFFYLGLFLVMGSISHVKATKPVLSFQTELVSSADSTFFDLFTKAVTELRSRNNKNAEKFFIEAEEYVSENEIKNFELLYRYKVNYGALLKRMGRLKDALTYLQSAEDICKNHFGEFSGKLAPVYINMGNIYLDLKDYLKGQVYLEAVLFIIDQDPSASRWRASAIINLGIVSKQKGDFSNALKYFFEGLEIKRDIKDEDILGTLNNIGNCYAKLGNNKEADRYLKLCIEESIKRNGPNNFELASFYLNYAVFYFENENSTLSQEYLKKSYTISLAYFGFKHPDTAHCLKNFGSVFFKEGNYQLALEYYQKALVSNTYDFNGLDLTENPSLEQIDGQLSTLEILEDKAGALFKLYGKSNVVADLQLSLETFDLCVDIIDQIRIAYQDEESKLALNANEHETYSKAIEVAFTLFENTEDPLYKEIAFKYSERAKASSLRNFLNDVDAKTFGGIPEDLQNLERKLKQDIASFREKIYQERKQLQPKQDSISNWRHTLFGLNGEYEQMVKRFETDHPDYYALKYDNASISVIELQKQLKEDQILVEYALSDSSLYSFAFGRDLFEMKKVTLEKGELEKSITDIRACLKTNDFSDNSIKYYQDYISAAHKLYQYMLEPYDELIENKRLIIVPEGKLAYVPFGVLLKEKADAQSLNYRNLNYLVRHHPISYQNSATIAYKWQKKNYSRSSGNKLLAFAPEYDNVNDSILYTKRTYDTKLYPLPGAKIEVENISKVLDGEIYLNAFATETCFKERAERFDILHLAMHTILDNDNPMYSKLVFSQTGDSLNDGLLNTHEIYNMKLTARMVVLSACNTGDGKLLKGEGVMSLARGFFYSGCPSLIMTLWTVEDLSGSFLMSSFYKFLSQSYPKDVALQQAKLEYLETADPLKSHPYFWSGYVAIGNTETLFEFSMLSKILMLLSATLLFGAAYFFWKLSASKSIDLK